MEAPDDRPLQPQAIWGRELRHYRTNAGLTQAELAERINFSESLISGIETGQVPASVPFAQACDREFATGGALLRALDFRKARRFPSGFAEYLEVEKKTAMIRWYEGCASQASSRHPTMLANSSAPDAPATPAKRSKRSSPPAWTARCPSPNSHPQRTGW